MVAEEESALQDRLSKVGEGMPRAGKKPKRAAPPPEHLHVKLQAAKRKGRCGG